jgi:hypothetical protein
MFPDLRGLAYADDATIIGRLSQALKLAAVSKPMFKSDGNLLLIVHKKLIKHG